MAEGLVYITYDRDQEVNSHWTFITTLRCFKVHQKIKRKKLPKFQNNNSVTITKKNLDNNSM